MKTILRIAYRGMIRLYPASFRSEFGDDMLWIFDEELSRGNVKGLFVDAARSVVVRHLRTPSEQFATSGYYVEIESALPAQRIAQAIMAIFYFGLGLALIFLPGVLWILNARGIHGADHGWLLSHIGTVAASLHSWWPKK
jgi:hypothetical protein